MKLGLNLLLACSLLYGGVALAQAAASGPAPKATSKPAPRPPKTQKSSTKRPKPPKRVEPFKRIPGVRYVKVPLRIGTSWDFQYEQGIVVNKVPTLSRRFFGRVRFGMLWAREPWIIAVGAVMEGSGIPSLAWGVQFEVTHLWRGLWAQATISMDESANVFSALSTGFSLLGFEWQRRLSAGGTATTGYLIKLRVPIGIIFFAK